MPHGEGHGHTLLAPPGASNTLVLDIGEGVGALVIYADSELSEVEIEISPGSDETESRSHNQVHARRNRHGISYTAVYPSVPAGDYTIWWPDGRGAKASVTIHSGQVTEHYWS